MISHLEKSIRRVALLVIQRLVRDHPRLNERMIGYLAGRASHALSTSQHATWRPGVVDAGVVYALHAWLSQLFAARQVDLYENAIANSNLGDLGLYHRIRLANYRGTTPLTIPETQAFHERVQRIPFLRRPALSLVLEQYIRLDAVEPLKAMLAELDLTILPSLTRPVAMGALRLLVRHGERDLAQQLLGSYLVDAPPERRLYFLEFTRETLDGDTDTLGLGDIVGWRAALAALLDHYTATDETDREEFERYMARPLEHIPPGPRDLMDVRFSESQREHLIDTIESRLTQRQPLSLVRLGDGEAYAFEPVALRDTSVTQFEDDNRVREIHWWGTNPPPSVVAAIQRDVRAAANEADILGIPSVYRFIRDLGETRSRFGASRLRRGLAVVMSAVDPQAADTQAIYTEERCHQVLFTQPVLERLCAAAERTVIVSCWSDGQLSLNCGHNTVFVSISPHTKVKDAYQGGEQQPLFATYERIDRQIADLARPGALVLVAAGLIGKIFINTARRHGAVALDVGSVLDYMAGYKTRSISDIV